MGFCIFAELPVAFSCHNPGAKDPRLGRQGLLVRGLRLWIGKDQRTVGHDFYGWRQEVQVLELWVQQKKWFMGKCVFLFSKFRRFFGRYMFQHLYWLCNRQNVTLSYLQKRLWDSAGRTLEGPYKSEPTCCATKTGDPKRRVIFEKRCKWKPCNETKLTWHSQDFNTYIFIILYLESQPVFFPAFLSLFESAYLIHSAVKLCIFVISLCLSLAPLLVRSVAKLSSFFLAQTL